MRIINYLKRFLLVGILLFSSYFGFTQTANIRIIALDNNIDVDCYEIEYKKVGEGEECWINLGVVYPECSEWETNEAGNLYIPYSLPSLECDTMYQVRVRACKINTDLVLDRGSWAYVQFRTPASYTGGMWTWEIGPFDVYCRPVLVRPNAIFLEDIDNVEVFFLAEEYKIAEAIKKE